MWWYEGTWCPPKEVDLTGAGYIQDIVIVGGRHYEGNHWYKTKGEAVQAYYLDLLSEQEAVQKKLRDLSNVLLS